MMKLLQNRKLFPLPETEIALRQQKRNGNAQALLHTLQPIFILKVKSEIHSSERKNAHISVLT